MVYYSFEIFNIADFLKEALNVLTTALDKPNQIQNIM